MKRNGSFPAGDDLRRFLPPRENTVPPPQRNKIEPPTCVICDAQITNQVALRIRHGGVYRYGAELQKVRFIPRPFMDDTLIKWMCVADPDDEEYLSCAEEHGIVSEEELRFDDQLNGLAEGWCCICRESIEPMRSVPPSDHDQWSSALSLELGAFETSKMGVPLFHAYRQGHIHYHCIEDFGITLDRLIVVSDAPEWFHEDW